MSYLSLPIYGIVLQQPEQAKTAHIIKIILKAALTLYEEITIFLY